MCFAKAMHNKTIEDLYELIKDFTSIHNKTIGRMLEDVAGITNEKYLKCLNNLNELNKKQEFKDEEYEEKNLNY